MYNGRAGQTTVAPPRIESDLIVDGILDEPVWQQAVLLTGFSLYQPVDQRPAPDSTEVTTDRQIGMAATERRVTYAGFHLCASIVFSIVATVIEVLLLMAYTYLASGCVGLGLLSCGAIG